MQKRKLIRFLLLPISITGIVVISLVVLFSYAPDTSVPFPYITPPEKGYYIETTYTKLGTAFSGEYWDSQRALSLYKEEGFILKNIKLREWLEPGRTETFIMVSNVQFVAQNPSDLKELKEGDVVDIIGICAGMSKEWPSVVVIENCQFLPAGLAPLPLPGGPVFPGGY